MRSSARGSASGGGGGESLAAESTTSSTRSINSLTSLQDRRRLFAQQVALDAKFMQFTKRTTQQSVLSLPLRTPQAPMDGTEEANNAMRIILSQGFEFDRLEKYKKADRFAQLMGIEKTPTKNRLGAYCEEIAFAKLNARDQLFDRLGPAMQAAAYAAASKEEQEEMESLFPDKTAAYMPPKQPNVRVEVEKQSKIDLVDNRRPRYVDRALLPRKPEPTLVEKMIREQKEKEEAARLKRFNLSSEKGLEAARKQMEEEIAAAQQISSQGQETEKSAMELMGEERQGYRIASRQRRRNEAERKQSIARMFLQKEEIKYGQGRLTSSHNLKGKLEDPWSTVGGRYAPRPGDRTV
eukprot:scaffold6860_cov155-Ochromonas_danica.AAC.1